MVRSRLKKAKKDQELKSENVQTANRPADRKRGARKSRTIADNSDLGTNTEVPTKRVRRSEVGKDGMAPQKSKSASSRTSTRTQMVQKTVSAATVNRDKLDNCGDNITVHSEKIPNSAVTKTTVLTESRCFRQATNVSTSVTVQPSGTCSGNLQTLDNKCVDQSDFVKESGNTVLNGEMKDPFLERLLSQGFQTRVKEPMLQKSRSCVEHQSSVNIMHCLSQTTMGCKRRFQLQQSLKNPVTKIVADLSVQNCCSPFDRRVTALEWHPTKHNILAVGSKGGDIVQLNVEDLANIRTITGAGKAGSCQAMKFWPWDRNKIVSASIDGTVSLHNFELQHHTVLADTMNSHDHWYTSLDVNLRRYMVAAGRNNGALHLMSTEGREIFQKRLHKGKITHVEFSPREEWLLCTASVDQTVALWDVRNIKDKNSKLVSLAHNKPVNSAYFSSTDGCRLLTTDQGCEIRVYESPAWNQTMDIRHPHRFFQHISPFKATWHPLRDMMVCGRYPDKSFSGVDEPRSVDVMDADTGHTVYQLQHPDVPGLCPLNKFNKCGDRLVSGMGFHIMLWDTANERAMKLAVDRSLTDKYLGQSRDTGSQGSRSRSHPKPRNKKKTDDVDTLKKQQKTKVRESSTLKVKVKKESSKKEK